MRLSIGIVLPCLVLVCALSGPALGYTQLWYQAPNNGQFADISDFPWNRQVADDFLFSNTSTVTSVRWWGAYGANPDPAPVDNFVIRFFNNHPNSPFIFEDTPELNPYVQMSVSVTRTLTAFVASPWMGDGGPVYEFVATLPTAQTFAPNTHYWMSIVNNTGSDWGWFLDGDQNSGSGFLFGHFTRPLDGTNWTRYTYCTNTAYELRGEPVIPEASTVALGLLGLAGVRLGLWRRKSH